MSIRIHMNTYMNTFTDLCCIDTTFEIRVEGHFPSAASTKSEMNTYMNTLFDLCCNDTTFEIRVENHFPCAASTKSEMELSMHGHDEARANI